MTITCDCSVEVDSGPEFYEEKIVKGRKKYKCIECDADIEIGERHEYVSGRWEGEFDTIRTCLPCSSIRKRFCPNGFEFGNLREALFECLGVDYVTNRTNKFFDAMEEVNERAGSLNRGG